MAWQLRSTIFGQAMRLLSGRKFFRYADEIDPSLWKKAVQLYTNEQRSIVADITNKEAPDGYENPSPQSQARQTDREKFGKQDILVVGWYGPDDPEVRFSVLLLLCCLKLIYYFTPESTKLAHIFEAHDHWPVVSAQFRCLPWQLYLYARRK